MKENGFTLVEILAVLVLLGLIALVTFPSVSRSIRDARKDRDSVNIDTVLNAAYDFAQQNISYLPVTTEEPKKICAQQLICAGLVKEEVVRDNIIEDYASHAITVTYYATKPETEKENSKFFGNYQFTFVEDSSCATYVCTTVG